MSEHVPSDGAESDRVMKWWLEYRDRLADPPTEPTAAARPKHLEVPATPSGILAAARLTAALVDEYSKLG